MTATSSTAVPTAAAMAAEQSEGDAFDRGVQAMKSGKLEDAVQLLGQALQSRVVKHGDDALECASAYYRYGCALFYRAQEESDVFGAPLQSTVAARDEGPSSSVAPAEAEGARAGPADDGKGKGVAASKTEADEGDEEEGDDAEEDGNGEDTNDDDMQLAWENLEVARAIYSRHQDAHTSELADVHMLLADLATEQESFETALEDLNTALSLLKTTLKAHDRRLAELHYKMCLTLQFLQRPEEALERAGEAKAICAARLQALEGSQESSAAAEKADLEAVLEDLADKEAELKAAVEELSKTRATLRSAFQQAFGGSAGGGGQLPGAPPTANGVVDLGVVGRGKKRLNLAPLQPSEGAPKPKRSLEDLMGGGEPPPKFSFQPAPAGMSDPGTENKKPRTEAQVTKAAPPATSHLPAFLQPKNVQAIYGQPQASEETDGGNGP